MVEKWDPVWNPGTPGTPVPWDPMDPRDPQDLWTLPLPFEIQTFINYIIGQSQTKTGNCVCILRLCYLSSC